VVLKIKTAVLCMWEGLVHIPVADCHLRFSDPTLADAILNRTIHNAYRLYLSGESQEKVQGNRSMPHT
jgi:hypothetical protein